MQEEPNQTWNPWGDASAENSSSPESSPAEVTVPPSPPHVDQEPMLPANVNTLGNHTEEPSSEPKDPHDDTLERLERIEDKLDKILGRL